MAICICTYKRQELLRASLEGVAQLTFDKVLQPQVKVVVVDNDPLGSAEEVCKSVSLPWPIQYSVESRRGITYARNHAIAEAGSVDCIAFLDDDEAPCALWLDKLLGAKAEFNADVVSGPVVPRYAPEVPQWVREGGFFDGRTLPTGTARNTCATNNVLIGTNVLRDVPGFDHDFALSGAEDTNFFLRVAEAGHKIIWCQNAVVSESVSADRGTVRWILRREYQTGNGWVFCEAGVNRSLRARSVRLTKALAHVGMGSASALVASLLFNKSAVVRSLQRAALGAGMLMALAGRRFQAYRNTSLQQRTKLAGRDSRSAVTTAR